MPASEGISKLSGAEEQRFGLPQNIRFYSAAPFGSMNQNDARTAMEDTEFFLLENFILVGKSALRSTWDIGGSIYVAPVGKTIVYFQWFNINGNVACAVFLSDGTAVQVGYPNNVVTPMTTIPGTFYNGTNLPVATQSGTQFLLIGNNINQNNYWVWDGSVLYAPGGIGPFIIGNLTSGGANYTSAPTVTIYGGAGTGATATATISDGAVVALTVTNPGTGYDPADTVAVAFGGGGTDSSPIFQAVLTPIGSTGVSDIQVVSGGHGYTAAPTVTITGGGGSGAAATAIIANGAVTSIDLFSPGSGYTGTPTVTLSGGAGTGAAAVAVLAAASVTSVTVINGGSGYTGTPQLTFNGGGGTGAAGTAVVTGGVITSVTMTAPGTGYISPPTVEVQAGLNNAASAQIDIMPFGVSGTSIETFQSRVWISNPAKIGPIYNGGVINVSAPASVTDFSSTAGGDLFTSNDRFLRSNYVAMHQSNGYLYAMADSSVSVISNVQTSGTPTVTTFNYQNTSAQTGVAWRDTVQDYGQSIIFGNPNGAFSIYGGAVQRVSRKMDDVFVNAIFPPTTGAVMPSGAVANIQTIPVYLINMTIKDPITQVMRTVMLAWNEKEWFIVSQSRTMTFINTLEMDSVMSAWGTDGLALFPLMAIPSASLVKRIATKMWSGDKEYIVKEPLATYMRFTDKSAAQSGVSFTITMESWGIAQQAGPEQLPSYTYVNPVQPNSQAPNGTGPVWGGQAPAVPGTALGATITTQATDVLISGISFAFREVGAIFG